MKVLENAEMAAPKSGGMYWLSNWLPVRSQFPGCYRACKHELNCPYN